MHDPLEQLLAMHRAASGFGCGLKPALLARIEQRSLSDIRTQPNVVILGTASSQSGPAQSASPARIAADDKLTRFRRLAG